MYQNKYKDMTERWNGQNYDDNDDDDCCCCGGGGGNKSGGVVGWCDDSNNHQNTSYNFLETTAVLPYFHIIRHSCLSNLSCTHNSWRSKVATQRLWTNFLICIYMGKKNTYFHYNIYFCIVSTGSVTVVVQIKRKTTYEEVRTDRVGTKT